MKKQGMNFAKRISRNASSLLTSILILAIFSATSLAPVNISAYTEQDELQAIQAKNAAAAQSSSVFNSGAGAGTINTGNSGIIINNSGLGNTSQTSSFVGNGMDLSGGSRSRSVDPQAEAYGSDTASGGGGGSSGGGGGVVSDAVGCAAGSILGQSLAMGLRSLVGAVVSQAAGALTNVPIVASALGDNISVVKDAADANTAINAIQQIKGIPIGASFNGIAYCVVNSVLEYITKSTIAWAKSGFKGNPAFLENPENFLRGIADKQANQFIAGLAYNTNGANACQPFRADLGIALSESYGDETSGLPPSQLGCSMDQGAQNFSQAGIGQAQRSGYWSNWNSTAQPENNRAGVYIQVGSFLKKQVVQKQDTAKTEISLNQGFLNFKKCEDVAAARRGDTSSCKTTTPGALIKTSLDNTIQMARDRLVNAEKIDQMITAITNALIKKALNTILEQ